MSATIQWYRSPLDKQELKDLTARSDTQGLIHSVVHIGVTAGLGVVTYHALGHWHPLAAAGMFYLYASVFAFMGISGPGHELIHGTVFRTKALNEGFKRFFCFFSWSDVVGFHESHNEHHQYTVHHGLDGEVVLPQNIRLRDVVCAFTINVQGFIMIMHTYIRRSFGNITEEREMKLFPESATALRKAFIRWARIVLVGHLLLAALFVAIGQWKLLLLITLAPFCAGWAVMLCALPQHFGMQPDVPDFRLCCRSIRINPVFQFLYWNMNYHIEHHMYAGVPFYNLPKLSRRIHRDLPEPNRGLYSAWKEMMYARRRVKLDPSFCIRKTIPSVGCADPFRGSTAPERG